MNSIIWTISKQSTSCSVQNIKYHPVNGTKTNKKHNFKESTTKNFSKMKFQRIKISKSKFTNWNRKLLISTYSMKNPQNTRKSLKNNSITPIKFANKTKTEWKNLTWNSKDSKVYADSKTIKKIIYWSKPKSKIKCSSSKTKSTESLLKPSLKVSSSSKVKNPKIFKTFGRSGRISLKPSVKINGQSIKQNHRTKEHEICLMSMIFFSLLICNKILVL